MPTKYINTEKTIVHCQRCNAELMLRKDLVIERLSKKNAEYVKMCKCGKRNYIQKEGKELSVRIMTKTWVKKEKDTSIIPDTKAITGFVGCLINGFTFDHSLAGCENRNFLRIINN